MSEAEFYNLLQRYLKGDCSPVEEAQVEQWYDRLGESDRTMLCSQDPEVVETIIWQRLAQGKVVPVPPAEELQPALTFGQAPLFRWAAVLLVGLGLGGLLLRTTSLPTVLPHTVATTIEQEGWMRWDNTTRLVQRFQLPDSSQVELHPGSSLRYARSFAGPKREVYLQGEAFFKVRKNPARPFLVFTDHVVTTVLGTSFRVKAYPHEAEATVAVREGKVDVQPFKDAQLDATPTHPATAGVLLLPNQRAVYRLATHRLHKTLVDKPVMLVAQPLEFEARPVKEVFSALEKAYGIHLVYDQAKLAHCTVSIAFYDEPLSEKLDLLCKSLGASYSVNTDQIIIRSQGCQTK